MRGQQQEGREIKVNVQISKLPDNITSSNASHNQQQAIDRNTFAGASSICDACKNVFEPFEAKLVATQQKDEGCGCGCGKKRSANESANAPAVSSMTAGSVLNDILPMMFNPSPPLTSSSVDALTTMQLVNFGRMAQRLDKDIFISLCAQVGHRALLEILNGPLDGASLAKVIQDIGQEAFTEFLSGVGPSEAASFLASGACYLAEMFAKVGIKATIMLVRAIGGGTLAALVREMTLYSVEAILTRLGVPAFLAGLTKLGLDVLTRAQKVYGPTTTADLLSRMDYSAFSPERLVLADVAPAAGFQSFAFRADHAGSQQQERLEEDPEQQSSAVQMEAQERSSTSKRKLDDEDVPSDEQEQPESKRLKMDDDTAETEVAAEAVNADAAQEAAEAEDDVVDAQAEEQQQAEEEPQKQQEDPSPTSE
jgi:hypothetical protein